MGFFVKIIEGSEPIFLLFESNIMFHQHLFKMAKLRIAWWPTNVYIFVSKTLGANAGCRPTVSGFHPSICDSRRKTSMADPEKGVKGGGGGVFPVSLLQNWIT